MGDTNQETGESTPIKLIDLDGLSTYHDLMDAKKEEHSVTLTLAQYNALSPEEKMNGKTYYISDAGSSGMVITASDVLMTGYSKASSASAITTNDTGSIAFGKLEKGLEDKVDSVSGKGLSTNDYTDADQSKLSGIASGAEVNQNAFSNVKVGSTTIAADSKTDTLELVAGTNITLTPDATNDTVTIAATGGGNTVSKTRYQISSSSWSSSANSDGFYTLTTTLNPAIGSSPDVYVAGSADGTQPTDTEKEQFAYVKRCKVNGSTLTLYASSKPSSTFYIWVEGVNGTGSGDIVGNVIQPNGASGDGFTIQTHSVSIAISDWYNAGSYYIYDIDINTGINLTNKSVFADVKSFMASDGTNEIGLNGFSIRRYPAKDTTSNILIRLTRLSASTANGTITVKLLII